MMKYSAMFDWEVVAALEIAEPTVIHTGSCKYLAECLTIKSPKVKILEGTHKIRQTYRFPMSQIQLGSKY